MNDATQTFAEHQHIVGGVSTTRQAPATKYAAFGDIVVRFQGTPSPSLNLTTWDGKPEETHITFVLAPAAEDE